MARDPERVDLIRRGMQAQALDLLVCSFPKHVLLLTGYWPVVGNALAASDGRVIICAPEDEKELAAQGWADTIYPFQPGSLDELTNADRAVRGPLARAVRGLGMEVRCVGLETGGAFEPATYASVYRYGLQVSAATRAILPDAAVVSANDLLAKLCAVPTRREADRVHAACRIAGQAFEEGARQLSPGLRESEIAARFRAPLEVRGIGRDGVERAGGYAFCMSGPNSARAFGAYARSRARPVRAGEFILVHCNSYADGFWTDVTRTYCLGEPDHTMRRIYDAVFAARTAAMEAVRPGGRAADVDRAARAVLEANGFGAAFKHPTGHGVGFAAISHTALPRLHPKSADVLTEGMVFNVEPAVYVEGMGGMRHCDVVTVTDAGARVLTPFHGTIDELIVPCPTTVGR